MDFRLATMKDLPLLKSVYKDIIQNMEKQQVCIWDDIYPCEFFAEDIPRYQIYTHNCDTVARELLALADEEIRQYNSSACALTPAGNYRSMCRRLSGTWGIMRLGEDSPVELLLAY